MSSNKTILELTHFLKWREGFRRPVVWGTHLGVFLVSGTAAFLLRFDFNIPRSEFRDLLFGLVVWLIVKSAVFRWLGLDRGWWRFVSIDDVARISLANFVASLASFAIIWSFGPPGFPRSIYCLDCVVCFLGTSGVRVLVRVLREIYRAGGGEDEKQIFIYGAGAAGVSLLREIRANPKLSYAVQGFIDDDKRKARLVIQGTKVLGTGADLPRLVRRHRIEMVLITVPTATGTEMTRILRFCQETGVTYKTVPGLVDMIEGADLARQIRDVAVEDLLGRNPVHLEKEQIRRAIGGKVVLVTGAAGSIGSELCRQMARCNPAGIVGFDIAESALFEIDREMHHSFPDVPFFPEIGSIQNRSRLEEVLHEYSPSVVYHAAAYKHVPLMEAHVFEAIRNNVFGTYNVAVAAIEHGVEEFVMVSSDKAVRPTNVMGATKRVAELLLLGLQNGRTKYVAVRFGNVLGSNGSVIPIFKKQIAAGGPVTVTHPEMRRFFMTIPEACQLILEAGAIAEGGQICVLDMGEPVKVVDLARNLILLSGLKPDEDIKIEFTGMRPGEKLYEELSTIVEDTVPSAHNKIRIFVGNGMPKGDVESWLAILYEICEAHDTGRLVVALKEIVPDYSPSAHLLRRIIGSGEGSALRAVS